MANLNDFKYKEYYFKDISKESGYKKGEFFYYGNIFKKECIKSSKLIKVAWFQVVPAKNKQDLLNALFNSSGSFNKKYVKLFD